jgi:hypothetical protein
MQPISEELDRIKAKSAVGIGGGGTEDKHANPDLVGENGYGS